MTKMIPSSRAAEAMGFRLPLSMSDGWQRCRRLCPVARKKARGPVQSIGVLSNAGRVPSIRPAFLIRVGRVVDGNHGQLLASEA